MYVRPLRPILIVAIEFFRATPILVQLLWVAYVWPALFGWPNGFFEAAWLALGLQSSGYLAETFRGAIEAVPKGQREAAYSVGMSPVQVMASGVSTREPEEALWFRGTASSRVSRVGLLTEMPW